MKQMLQRYIIVFVVTIAIFLTLSVYLNLRRGYYDLYIINKAFAGTAFILISMVLSLGTLARLYDIFDKLVQYRKEFGITSFFLGTLHSVISFFFLQDHFSVSYFAKNWVTFLFGLTATIILTVLFIFSIHKIVDTMDKRVWWHIQNWGIRLVGITVLLHVIPMKYAGWIKWYINGGGNELLRPYFPPTGFLVTLIGVLVVIIRLSDRLEVSLGRKVIQMSVVSYFLFIVFSFWIGILKTPTALPLDWDTCIKLPNSKISYSNPPVCEGTGGRIVTIPQ